MSSYEYKGRMEQLRLFEPYAQHQPQEAPPPIPWTESDGPT